MLNAKSPTSVFTLPEHTLIKHLEDIQCSAIINRRVWEVTRRPHSSSSAYLIIGNQRYALEESCSVDEIENDYYQRNKDSIENLVRQQSDNRHSIQDLRKSQFFSALSAEPVLSLIFNKILPLHYRRDDYNDELMRVLDISPNKGKEIDKIRKVLREQKGSIEKYAKKLKKIPALKSDINYFVWQGNIYKLNNTRSHRNKYVIQIRGQQLVPELDNPVNNIRSLKLLHKLSLDLSIKKVADTLSKENNEELEKKLKAYEELYSNGSFENDGIGVLYQNREYHIFLRVPAFTLKNGHEYRFPSCRVGIALRKNNNIIQTTHPVVIDRYSHPFLPKANESFQSICLGKNSIPTLINESHIKAYAILRLAANTLKNGYINNPNAHRLLTVSNFPDNVIR